MCLFILYRLRLNDIIEIMSKDSDRSTEVKIEQLKELLKGLEKPAIAYSGGVDSTFLLKIASIVLGDITAGIYIDSPLQPSGEKEEALQLAGDIGAKVFVVGANPLSIKEFRENYKDRCYFCKRYLFDIILKTAREKGYTTVVDGSNHDDKNDYRPGSKALQEYGIRSPLQEVGLTKEEIRKLSKLYSLPTWDKDAYACLASRIPFYQEITPTRIKQVDKTEKFLTKLGYRNVRARHFGEEVHIEVRRDQVKKLQKAIKKKDIMNAILNIGFTKVFIDPEGYRQGKLNYQNTGE
jgi:uncharacterized protein